MELVSHRGEVQRASSHTSVENDWEPGDTFIQNPGRRAHTHAHAHTRGVITEAIGDLF